MRHFLAVTALGLVAGLSSASAAVAQATDSYCATISENDKFASDGFALNDAASIIRQDRANYHRFGIRDFGDENDSTFRTAEARERIPAMIDSAGMPQSVARAILTGTPDICVSIYGRRAMEVVLASAAGSVQPAGAEYPFEGAWDCEVAMFTFTPFTYNNGSEDLPIEEIQEGSDGSYTLLFEDGYYITLSGFTGNSMGWFSGASGDSFNCRRID